MKRTLTLLLLASLSMAGTATPPSADTEPNAIAAKMKARNIAVDKVQRLSKHLIEMSINGETVYATPDGDIMLFGQAVQFDKNNRPTNLTVAASWRQAETMIADGTAMTFKAPKEKASVVVFTDVTCGYCQKFHSQVPELTAKGITVHYVAYPRSGPGTPSFENMSSAWCAADPREAISALFLGGQVPNAKCAKGNAVDKGWALGQKVSLQGTPTLMLPGGHLVTGYHSVEDIIKMLAVPTA